ncbi:antirestriction protein [Serratia microhaemolytica]|uniref:antirestriction protein n=1 Tax=Serratia microhaemolytica TaxID=2675110 RepID=UPI000FDF220A|nr:antirestriction protein [Serratia microhaemolytica]
MTQSIEVNITGIQAFREESLALGCYKQSVTMRQQGRQNIEYNLFVFNDLCFRFARQFCDDYLIDSWDWYTLSNGGFFICPKTEKTYRISVQSNYYQGEMSAQALGITVSLFALCALAELAHDKNQEDEYFTECYHWLRDYSFDVRESFAIAGAID